MDSVTASDMLDEFRLMEGTLFQDEEAKLFYLDIRGVVLDSLVAAWDKFSTSDVLFQTALDRYYAWEGAVGHEEVERCLSDVHKASERHFHVAVFYSRQLYGNEDFNQKIVIAKPKIEILLKTLFRRLVRNLHIKSGAFFSFDPIKQDFIIRDAFRQALAESIKIVDISSNHHNTKRDKQAEDEKPSTHVEPPGHEIELIPESKVDLKLEIETENKRETEQKPEAELEREAEQKPEVEPEQKPEVEPEHEAEPEQKPEVEVEREREHEPEPGNEENQQHKEFDVKKVDEDYNVGDSVSVFLEPERAERKRERSILKVPTMVRTVFLS